MIYFDNAATSFPKPKIVKDSLKDIFYKYGGNPGRSGHKMAMNTSFMVYKCREKIADFFNADNVENVVFTLNCTMAANMVIKGILSKGDHVIISSYEHNANLRPIHKLKEKGLISYDVANVYEGDDEKTLQSFQNLIKSNTKLVIAVHGSNVFGNILPIKGISNIAHKNGAMFMVDAAQSAGVIPIDIQKMNIDFLCMPGHKSLYGLSGTGVLITKHGDKLSTIIEGGTGSVSESFVQPNFMPDKLESGTGNSVGILGLYNGLKFITSKGIDNIYKHEMRIIQYIYKNLHNNKNVKLYTQYPTLGSYLPVLSFNIDKKTCDDVVNILSKKGFATRGGLHCSPLAHKSKGTLDIGTVRISVGAFNNLTQAKKLCNVISNI